MPGSGHFFQYRFNMEIATMNKCGPQSKNSPDSIIGITDGTSLHKERGMPVASQERLIVAGVR